MGDSDFVIVKRAAGFPDIKLPEKKTSGSAGFDLACAAYVAIKPREIVLVHTGVCLEMGPELMADLRARSGLSSEGVLLATGVSTIDSDYRGEIRVPLLNMTDETYNVYTGDRIAQLVFHRSLDVVLLVSNKDLSPTERGDGGFGSTGA